MGRSCLNVFDIPASEITIFALISVKTLPFFVTRTPVRTYKFIYKDINTTFSYYIPVCSVAKLSPQGTVDNLIHYCMRPLSFALMQSCIMSSTESKCLTVFSSFKLKNEYAHYMILTINSEVITN